MTSSSCLVVFDLDGTLNRTDLYVVPAFAQTLQEFGLPAFSREQILSAVGGRAEDYRKFFLPQATEAQRDAFFQRETELERIYMEQKSGTFEHIYETLEQLKKEGCLLAVCSNAEMRYIDMVLQHLKLLPYMDYKQELRLGLTKADTLKLLLERVNPEKAVMVGDRIFDLEAARANDLPFIGCLYGYSPEEVRSADWTVQDPLEIVAAVRSLVLNGL